jgi:hypothetical protein
VTHKISLVDRHQSNGVEPTNKMLLERLRALCAEKRFALHWGAPRVLKLVQFVINSQVSSETGVSPFMAKFGSMDAAYLRLPTDLSLDAAAPQMLKELDEDLRLIRSKMVLHQDRVLQKRAKGAIAELQNVYQPGDFVLFEVPRRVPKLSGLFLGPYEVVIQRANDVDCRHLCTGAIKTLHVSRLKIFHGNREEALRVAKLDYEQHDVSAITGYCGDPLKPRTMELEVTFQDGDVQWCKLSKDITSTAAFEDFCNAKPFLRILLFLTVPHARQYIKEVNAAGIHAMAPGVSVFVDLRADPAWYFGLEGVIPDVFHTCYVIKYTYSKWIKPHKVIQAHCPLLQEHLDCDAYWVKVFGSCTEVPDGAVLVDEAFLVQYPKVAPAPVRKALLAKAKA